MFGSGMNPFAALREDVNMLVQRDWQKDDLQDQREDAERTWYRNYESQKEFAQHGVQWRVEDAQRAGLHPVFALGGAGAAFSPTSIVGSAGGVPDAGMVPSDMGQDLSRAARAEMTPEARAMHEMQLKVMQSQVDKNDAESWLYMSRAMGEAGQQGPGMPVTDPNLYAVPGQNPGGMVPGSGANLVELKPSAAESYALGDPGLAAAVNPLVANFRMGGGTWALPSKAASEALESVSESWLLQWILLRENMRRNPNFLRENKFYIPFGDTIFDAIDWWQREQSKPVRKYRGFRGDR